MLKIIISIFLIFGLSFTLWSLIGLIRFIYEAFAKKNNHHFKLYSNHLHALGYWQHNVAVVMAAHNEELVIQDSIQVLKQIIPVEHIYVANDGSRDRTSQLARAQGCQVVDLYPNRSKAVALKCALEDFNLYDRYKFILFVDADTRLREDYLKNALPLFKDPQIAAVAGYARSQWKKNIFIAYRSRIWFTIQTFFRFGMSSSFANLNMIVPGFASMYRTKVLKQIDIAKPGLVIEDFNMTFELQKKKLGKIAHYRSITGYTQDPHNFKTYTSQIRRWNLGFWQTLRANGIWPSAFWLSLSVYLIEVLITSAIFLCLPLFLIFALSILILSQFISPDPVLISYSYLILQWFIFLFVLDHLYTLITAIVDNRPELLFYAPTMLFFRWLDAYYLFTTLFLAFNLKLKSTGAWVPPERWSDKKAESNLSADEAGNQKLGEVKLTA